MQGFHATTGLSFEDYNEAWAGVVSVVSYRDYWHVTRDSIRVGFDSLKNTFIYICASG